MGELSFRSEGKASSPGVHLREGTKEGLHAVGGRGVKNSESHFRFLIFQQGPEMLGRTHSALLFSSVMSQTPFPGNSGYYPERSLPHCFL